MNLTNYEEKTIKIVYEVIGNPMLTSPTYIKACCLTTYDNLLLELLNKSEGFNSTKTYLIFIKDLNGEKLEVNKNNFESVKERVLGPSDNKSANSEDRVVFIVQEEVVNNRSKLINLKIKTNTLTLMLMNK